MKIAKKILAVMLSVMIVALCFAGCSKAEEAGEIDSHTMLIAYTEEVKPFIYTDENGELTGFDVELFKTIFNDVKGENKTYEFVQVDKDYKLGEDVYCVDSEGKDCIAYIMIGGIQKDVDDVNNTLSFTNDVINNRVITVTKDGTGVTDCTTLAGKSVGVVSDVAKAALDKNATVKAGLSEVKDYADADSAIKDLEAGTIQAIVIDEFDYYTAQADVSALTVLNGELENVSYVFALKKWDWYVEVINEAIYELQSPDYNDADEFTPIVEKYFGYDASSFDFVPSETK